MPKTTQTKEKKEKKAPKTAKPAASLEAKMFSQEGKDAGTIALPEAIFGLPWNADLVHQVVTAMRANAREPIAHTKMRGEVRGGGKKPWKQKGTGRARHGSTRSPIWVGGGVTHGPRNDKDYSQKINKKMKIKAIFTILSKKMREGEVLFLKELSLSAPKSKIARETFTKMGTVAGFEKMSARRNNAALITVSTLDKNVKLGFQNFSNLEVNEIRNINPLALMQYKYVVITSPEDSFKTLLDKMTVK